MSGYIAQGFEGKYSKMCLSLYLAAPRRLPLVPWDLADPSFHVVDVPSGLTTIRKHFEHEHVYYVGSREGCSCAFNYEHDDRAILELREYLKRALQDVEQLQAFVCRVGCEPAEVQHRQATSPDGVALPDFYFREAQFLTIRRNAATARVMRGKRRRVAELRMDEEAATA